MAVDDRKESFKMTDYLIGLGHKDIAIITARREDESIGKLRLLGYQQALEKHGIPFDEDLVCYMDPGKGQILFESGYELTKQLMQRDKEVYRSLCHFRYTCNRSLPGYDRGGKENSGRCFSGGI